jgi:hypothetical protein
VASLRWFAHAGYSISHMVARLDPTARQLGTREEWVEATLR